MKYLLILIPVLLSGCVGETYTTEQLDNLAQCMTDNGVVEYGSFVCISCEEQKDLFGTSFQYINYTECHPNGPNAQYELCKEKGITATPTWMIGDKSLVGKKSIKELAAFSGCEVSGNG